jgi:hypothetical protein
MFAFALWDVRSPTTSAISCARWRRLEPIKDWSLTSLKEKLIKIGFGKTSHPTAAARPTISMVQEASRLIRRH